MLRKLKLEKKILIIITSLLFIVQLISGILIYTSINKTSKYSSQEAKNLTKYISGVGESSLKSQNNNYLETISKTSAEMCDSFFDTIENHINNFCSGTEKIYQNSEVLPKELLFLPDMMEPDSAGAKAYAVDKISDNHENILVYNIPEYNKTNNNLYVTNINSWNELSQEQRSEITQNNIVVSENYIPEDIKQELLLLNNLKYITVPIFNNSKNITSIYLGTKSGILYKYSGENSREKYDPRLRPWYISAVENTNNSNDSIVWQSAYISKTTGKLCITCSRAFKNSSGEVLGVVAIDMNLDNISNYIKNLKISNNNYNFILDSNKNIIINSDFDISQEIINNNITQNTGSFNININNKKYYLSYNLLKSTNWIFVTVVPEEYITEPVSNMNSLVTDFSQETINSLNQNFNKIILNHVIIFVIFMVVIYIISVKLAKSISRPIINLSKKSKEIGNGNLSLRIPIETEDEIGELAQSFNTMTENLDVYIKNLAKTTAEKEKIHSELKIAKQIQNSMLPCIFPAFPEHENIDIYAIMDPAREVGGDFYDFFFIDSEKLVLVVADVSDKGVSAALFMVVAKILIKNELQNNNSLEETLRKVNEKLCENNTAGMFVTCFISIININTGKFVYSNAGHNPPIIYRKNENTCVNIKDQKSFVLGAMNNIKYKTTEDILNPEDILIFYTDGVTEAINTKHELFSEHKLKEIIINSNKNSDMKSLVTDIRSAIDVFSDGEERADDITILCFKINK